MSKTMIRGSYYTAAATVHTGAGILLGLLISHTEADSAQTVTLYNNTAASGTVLLAIDISPEASPTYLVFPRDLAPAFTTGLHVVPGKCKVAVWGMGT